MVGSIKSHTKNFKFIIPEFNVATWHDYIEENFRSIDALFQNLFGINGFSGMWKTNTAYEAGQVLFVGEDNGSIYEGRLVKVIQDTNTGGFATFSEAINLYPNHYEMYADASSAQLFANLAKDWASKTGSTVKTAEGDDTGEYSAKHYQTLAKGNEEQCEMYKNLTDTNVQLTQDAVVSAETFAQNSETSAQNALVSEQNSKLSETNAKTSEQNAKNSEDNAKIYETVAANSIVALKDELSDALSEINSKTNVLDETMITNCLTYIPQDIKLELNTGTLTLKGGSKAYNGNGLFITTTKDVSISWQYTGTGFVFVKTDGQIEVNSNGSETVSSLPAPSTSYKIFYNTADGKCYYDYNNTQMVEISFPIATFTANNGITSIDQVFNGFGYIGSTVFALPGVKGLIPNSRNVDGSLKNIKFTIGSVQTITQTGPYKRFLRILANGTLASTTAIVEYNEEKNENVIGTTKQTLVECGTCEWDASNKIISLQPKTTFRAVDYNDKATITYWGD